MYESVKELKSTWPIIKLQILSIQKFPKTSTNIQDSIYTNIHYKYSLITSGAVKFSDTISTTGSTSPYKIHKILLSIQKFIS